MEVPFQQKLLSNGRIRCNLCPHRCVIPLGEKGICRIRENRDGSLLALNYGKVTAITLDPIETKPLNRFHPGSTVLSLGSIGCNFHCRHCQNWEIAHKDAPTLSQVTPQEAIDIAKHAKKPECIGLAYSFSEPLMFYEWVLETAQEAKKAGLKNVLVTNGYINPEPLAQLLQVIDAFNIDIKSFQKETHRNLCSASLEPVLETVSACLAAGKHVELTTTLIPGWNDSPGEITKLTKWIASLDRQTPLHLNRYYPNYKLNLPPTPLETLYRAQSLAQKSLDYVYVNNIDQA